MKKVESRSKSVYKLALELTQLPFVDKKKLIYTFFKNLSERQKSVLLEHAFKASFDLKYFKVIQRLEKIFTKDYSVKPVVAARMVRYYLKIPTTMLPLLVRLAQKAKDRVRKRMSAESCNT